jgi:hypothetical protein
MSGTARSIGSALPTGPEVAVPIETAPYRTRLLVRRPADPRRFNGTVLVEWFNVTAGQDFEPVWIWSHPELMREGYAYVAVSAQAVGVDALRTFLDPVRYRSLTHPGDQFATDIFSQALKAMRQREGADPLGGLRPEHVLATGESQSAGRLYDYIDSGAERDSGVADGILLDAGGDTDFPHNQPSVPVLQFRGEEQALPAPRSASPDYRVWWVAGASHIDSWALRFVQAFLPAYLQDDHGARFDPTSAGAYGERGGTAAPACTQQSPDAFPERYAMDAAIHALDGWVRTGVAPPSSPEFEYKPGAENYPSLAGYTVDIGVERDEDGNIRGGLRLPPIAVPLAAYNGNQCWLVGYTVPFDDAKLHSRYPTFADYYSKLRAAARTSVAGGYRGPPTRAICSSALVRPRSAGRPRRHQPVPTVLAAAASSALAHSLRAWAWRAAGCCGSSPSLRRGPSAASTCTASHAAGRCASATHAGAPRSCSRAAPATGSVPSVSARAITSRPESVASAPAG